MSEIKVKLLALCILCTPLACSAQDFSPEFVRHVFLNLDMTSFPNSMGPTHYAKGTVMKKILKTRGVHEIKKCKDDNNCIVIHFPEHDENSAFIDDGWYYYLTLIKKDNDKILACYTDINGWDTYNVTQPLELKKVKGKFIVTKAYNKSIDRCEYLIKG
ncbi:hypothetical protein GFE35_21580 [Salmonella enterica]|uniref:hypothetical protein n=1 Tax=Salmonella enterica TaxID=28901 RepID=UPI0002694FBC|nr:hypothetical protein [Salmonella enterica]EDJ5809067.1 hypothetical protein [Salmonella enterica]EEB1092765.1 hypothetical protein [Salmonella enterica]EEC1444744.1 hypothetical protein [Salmonella enterica]EGL0308499.1 hypothetical protein [Salmonella enterica]EJA72579.1 hypothetical protein SEEN978_10408 [Salmonella enterica subsp. enterica serovar Newport str. CVM 37978]